MSLSATYRQAASGLIRLAGAGLILAMLRRFAAETPAQIALVAWMVGLAATSEIVRAAARLALQAALARPRKTGAAPRRRAISQELPI